MIPLMVSFVALYRVICYVCSAINQLIISPWRLLKQNGGNQERSW
jgi:hypothetical protein